MRYPGSTGLVLFQHLIDVGDLPGVEIGTGLDCLPSDIGLVAFQVASQGLQIQPILVAVPNPAHPYGAKGVGEVTIVPPMVAIANAIDSAIHPRLPQSSGSDPKT